MKMPHATENPVKAVRNLLRRAVAHISDNSSILIICQNIRSDRHLT